MSGAGSQTWIDFLLLPSWGGVFQRGSARAAVEGTAPCLPSHQRSNMAPRPGRWGRRRPRSSQSPWGSTCLPQLHSQMSGTSACNISICAAEGIMIGVRAACRATAHGCRQRLQTAFQPCNQYERTLWHGARLEVIVCSEAVVTQRTRHGTVGRAGTLLTVGSRRSTLAYFHRTVCAGGAASVYVSGV